MRKYDEMRQETQELFDLLFPQKLRPLTYIKPDGMELSPGMFVRAELGRKHKTALVLGRAKEAEDLPPLKEVLERANPGWKLSPALLKLISWMAEYYMSEEGSVLKVMYGEGLFETPARKRKKNLSAPSPDKELISEIESLPLEIEFKKTDLFGTSGFKTFLFHASGGAYERAFVRNTIREFIESGGRGGIIVLPEISMLQSYESLLRPLAGERLSVLHGELPKREKAEIYKKILEGGSDIVLGTRLAVFAPVKRLEAIIVVGEQSENYKNEEGVRYNARDAAVARAFFEGAKAVLTSICPSAESYLNCQKGKYELIRDPDNNPGNKIRFINMRKARLESDSISGTLFKALSTAFDKGEKALLILNRFGHSVPFCEDCGHVERCPSCRIALTLHKTKKILLCNYCGHKKPSRESCPACGGANLKLLGLGLERLSEELRSLFQDAALADLTIGTRGVLKDVRENSLGVAGMLFPELGFFHPDFRSGERAFQELTRLADKLSPGKSIFVQTLEPGLFRGMKELDYDKFIRMELAERKELRFPPFSKMAILEIAGAKFIHMPDVRGTEVLGPAPGLSKRGNQVTKLLIKAPSGKLLRQAIREILNKTKALKIKIDIDPV